MSTATTKSAQGRKPALRRAHYAANLDDERRKARERTRRRRSIETEDEREHRLERHRRNQARYRENNRLMLRMKAWQSRKTEVYIQAREVEAAADEAEYQLLMSGTI